MILDIRSVFVIPVTKEFRSKVKDEDKDQSKNGKLKPEDLLVYTAEESVQFNLKSGGVGEVNMEHLVGPQFVKSSASTTGRI